MFTIVLIAVYVSLQVYLLILAGVYGFGSLLVVIVLIVVALSK